MKRIFTLSLLFAVFTCTSIAQTGEKGKTNGPYIEFESKVLDYGIIENGSDGQREFKFTNTGSEDLIILSCNKTCGCTVPECPKESFPPGESGIVKVKYDTKRTGSFNKTVVVNTNATNSKIDLIIKGEVKPMTTTEPVKDLDDHSGHNH